jgi:hypothetical protein
MVVQSQATGTVNLYGTRDRAGNRIGVMGGYGSGLLALSWSAFGLSKAAECVIANDLKVDKIAPLRPHNPNIG